MRAVVEHPQRIRTRPTVGYPGADTDVADVHPRTLQVQLEDDAWEARMGQAEFEPTAALLAGLQPLSDETRGWARVITGKLGTREPK